MKTFLLLLFVLLCQDPTVKLSDERAFVVHPQGVVVLCSGCKARLFNDVEPVVIIDFADGNRSFRVELSSGDRSWVFPIVIPSGFGRLLVFERIVDNCRIRIPLRLIPAGVWRVKVS